MIEEIPMSVMAGFISKGINDWVDSKKIKKANKDLRKYTIESRIYQFTIDVLNNITYICYEKEDNMDIIYDAAEQLLNSIKINENFIEKDIVSILKPLKNIGNEEYIFQNFKKALYTEIAKDNNQDLETIIIMGISISLKRNVSDIKNNIFTLLYDASEIKEMIYKLSQMLQSTMDTKVDFNEKGVNTNTVSETKKYLNKWVSNMFLNNPSDWDSNSDKIAVKLCDIYKESQLPHYKWRNKNELHYNLREPLFSYIDKTNKDNERMLLILGQPGIGKSTLITWIISKRLNLINDILVYTFSSLKNLVWQKQNDSDDITDKIVKELNLSYEELENKTLILDGFDEINVDQSARANILNEFYSNWKSNILLKNTLLIITCRENYIQNVNTIRCPYITLQAWNEDQIKNFCDTYQEKAKIEISQNTRDNIIKNKDVLGIPLLLYMTLALDISIEHEGSMVDVYDKIFALNGGIYDRCINNVEYSNDGLHRIRAIKKQIHKLSRKIAIYMFENEPEDAFIPITEYHELCDDLDEELKNVQNEGNLFLKDDILIGNFFKMIKHCEGSNTNHLYFVHRSIYQYFVAETIFSSINYAFETITEKTITEKTLTEETQKILAEDIVQYLKIGEIDNTIGNFLKQKIFKLYSSFGRGEQKKFYEWLDNSVCKMINAGFFSYIEENIINYENIKDIIEKELMCFRNLIKILYLFLDISNEKGNKKSNEECNGKCNKKFILQSANPKILKQYIFLLGLEDEKNNLSKIYFKNIYLQDIDLNNINLNLSNINFSNTNLTNANLNRAVLGETHLEGADLTGANLEYAHLEWAYLTGANLRKADLEGAYLKEADLTGANLTNADLELADLTGVDLREAIFDPIILKDAILKDTKISKERYSEISALGIDVDSIDWCD